MVSKSRWRVPVRWYGAVLTFAALVAFSPKQLAQTPAGRPPGRPQGPPRLVIEGGTLIDGTGAAPVKDSVVVIEGNRIKAAGIKGSISYPAGAKVIRAEGLTVLPGLIDAHIHELDFFPQLFPYFGVTTAYDIANPTQWSLAQREAMRTGKIKGPRLLITGVVIDGPDPGGPADRRDPYLVRVHTPEEARATARKVIGQGVDIVKVYQHLTPDLLRAVVEEAHKAGLEAVGHSMDARVDAEAGLKFIEHSTPIAHSIVQDASIRKEIEHDAARVPEADMDEKLFDPLIQLLVKNGVYYNPTLGRVWINGTPKRGEWYQIAAKMLNDPTFQFIPAERREFWLRMIKDPDKGRSPEEMERLKLGLLKVREFTAKYVQAGGKIIAGTDAGPSSHPANLAGLATHIEMEALVDAGLTPMQAILSATKWTAELLHKENDLGTVTPGKLADIILIDGDPLADIRKTRDIKHVILDGKMIDTTIDPNFRNPIPRPVAEYAMDSTTPELTELSPEAAIAGDSKLEITVTGKKFNAKSVVRFDMTDLPTKFISESKLTATVNSSLLKNPGTYAVTVINPGSGGGIAKELHLILKYRN